MKKLLFVCVSISLVVFVGCSPQQRLTYLLTRYPDLHRDSSWVVGRDVVLPADSAGTEFSIADMRDTLTIGTASGATATITPTKQADTYRLQVTTPADTIHIRDTITVPTYITRVEYKDKIVHKMNQGQSFFFWVGMMMMVLTVVAIVVRMVKKVS